MDICGVTLGAQDASFIVLAGGARLPAVNRDRLQSRRRPGSSGASRSELACVSVSRYVFHGMAVAMAAVSLASTSTTLSTKA